MSPPSCPTRTELDSFQAGDLDEVELGSVASHVESCPTCQRMLETIIGDSADPVLAALLAEPVANPFADEIACHNAIQRAAALAEGAASVARELAATISLQDHPGSAESEALPLESIREYKLLAKLGEGGMGAVYKALHTRLDKVVALKVLPADRMRDTGSVARFQREMKAVGRLDHPHIVRAMDAGEENGTHFLVMEYVAGIDLSQLANLTGRLPVADACELVRQAAIGLQEAHEHGMVHRDIKPSNLILAKSPSKKSPPTLKILDLGLALLSEGLAPDQELTSTGQMMGTIDYMAPEQGNDTHHVDIRADIYSLGATLYRLLTGAPPFVGERFDTPVKKLLALATQEPGAVHLRRTEVPLPLATIVHKMLAKDPAERYATPEELAEALAPFCQGANLAALLEQATRQGQSKSSGEAPTHPQLSSGSADTAPTIDYSIKGGNKPRPASRATLAGLGAKIPRSLAIATACVGGALTLLLGVVFYLETMKGTIRIEINDDAIKVVLDENSATFQGVDKKHSIKVQPGKHGLTITRGDLKFHTDKFELTRGETVRLSVKYLDGRVKVVDAASGKSIGERGVPSWNGWRKDAPVPAIVPFDAKQARRHQEEWAKHFGVPVEYKNTLGMKFVLIPPGEFMRGSTPKEIENGLVIAGTDGLIRACALSEAGLHKVILTQPVYLCTTEVTQRNYEDVMGRNPSHFSLMGGGKGAIAGLDTSNHPVEMVTWNDAAEFCTKLSQRERLEAYYVRVGENVIELDGNGYRIPTEAQWEFACRAGTTTRYWNGDTVEHLPQVDWFDLSSGSWTHKVGQLKVNPFGLFDIHGNVWEWVQDWWTPSYYSQFQGKVAIDPSGPSASSQHIIRGGDWFSQAYFSRSSSRLAFSKPTRRNNIGFRVALSVDAVKAAIANRKNKLASPVTSKLPIPSASTGVIRSLAGPPSTHMPVKEFREIHDVDARELIEWVKSLPTGFVPSIVTRRAGDTNQRFSMTAIQDGENSEYKLFPKVAEEDLRSQFLKLQKEGLQPIDFWKYEEGGNNYEAQVWVPKKKSWVYWHGPLAFISEKIQEGKSTGARPEQLGCFAADHFLLQLVWDDQMWWEAQMKLGKQQLVDAIDQSRTAGWRPDGLCAYDDGGNLRFMCVTVMDPEKPEWAFEVDLSSKAYSDAVETRRREGFYPRAIAAYGDAETPLFAVTWLRYRLPETVPSKTDNDSPLTPKPK